MSHCQLILDINKQAIRNNIIINPFEKKIKTQIIINNNLF